MAKTRFSLDNPDELSATLTHTLLIGEWKQLREQLDNSKWPAVDFIREISAVIAAAEKHFSEYSTEQPA